MLQLPLLLTSHQIKKKTSFKNLFLAALTNNASGSTPNEPSRMDSLFNKIFNKEAEPNSAEPLASAEKQQTWAPVNNEQLTMSVDSLENMEAAISTNSRDQQTRDGNSLFSRVESEP
jgi:hypothetical protein